MKCRLCQKREGKVLRFIEWAKAEVLMCEKCRRAECPTPEERESDALAEERRAEFQMELEAGCFDLP